MFGLQNHFQEAQYVEKAICQLFRAPFHGIIDLISFVKKIIL